LKYDMTISSNHYDVEVYIRKLYWFFLKKVL
jgi:hypothetical protein